ncbi:hypothetical protein ATANTOWER_024570 [Ataeniobius toweri]|uniref:Uncharacterized protein n=1 Tax=Ataeniobius toweri TaxID=208326 RepID=A0ABU7CIF5_9TELE|nr:hypothetical protein [Ataeniobius toweri]
MISRMFPCFVHNPCWETQQTSAGHIRNNQQDKLPDNPQVFPLKNLPRDDGVLFKILTGIQLQVCLHYSFKES